MSKETLTRVRIVSNTERIGLTCLSDMVILDKGNQIIAMRIGGYPESVQAMSDIIVTGCDLQLQKDGQTIRASSKGGRKYKRKISHDGIYAEAFHYLTDDTSRSLMLDDDSGGEDKKIAIDKNLYFFCENDDELYAELDRKLSVPLIPEFKDYFLSELKAREMLNELNVWCLGKRFNGYHMRVSDNEAEIAAVLEQGLKDGKISIPGAKQNPNNDFKEIKSFTEYLQKFSNFVASKIKTCFPPRFDPAKEKVCDELLRVNNYIIEHAGYSLFDAQLGAAEALKRQLEKDKMALLVAECGTGKTKIGSAALYAYQHCDTKKRVNQKAFNVVICPSHITEKWVRELHESIPDCLAFRVATMEDVDKVYNIYRRENKTVYCILSKETARNGYMRKPSVIWNPIKKGFVCPHCDTVQEMSVMDGDTKYTVNADANFFLNETGLNHKCQNCNEPLWSMYNPNDLSPSRNPWVRIGSYGFIHRKFLHAAYDLAKGKENKMKIEEVLDNPNGVFPARGAYARYPLSSYIKKKVRHIDALIVDELHQYSGESAQGQAMAELAGISDKVIGMTATLINGYAKGIFYLLFRLKAHLMLLDGQNFGTSGDFCRQYGVVEELYELQNDEFNTASKAVKHKIREKFLPGLSPIVYSKFLLENTVFLSLADMGKELPDYEEIPICSVMKDDVKKEYERLEDEFKSILRSDRKMGNKILSSYLNLLSAFPDQPYDHEPIYNPFFKNEKEELIVPKSIGNAEVLQPKDEELLKLIERKISENERVIIYTAWTRLDTQTKLHKLLNEKGIPTAILDGRVPTTKRENWVDKKVSDGVKVLIVNPALVETGLDLNAFTTLVFYNIAFNLYVFRQASRRSWRINQTAPKVEVYMFYYKDTMQQRALRLMATKLSAATVIEGNISDEGLAAMSDCEDLTTQLAKELVDGIKENTETLADSFKKMAIIGNGERRKTAVVTKPVVKQVAKDNSSVIITPISVPVRSGKAKFDTGQLSLLDLLEAS